MLKMQPSAMKASALFGACGSMNCGTKARKKIATFGFSALVRKPCAKMRGKGRAVTAAGSASPVACRLRNIAMPMKTRYAAPIHLTTMNAVAEVASTAERPSAAAKM